MAKFEGDGSYDKPIANVYGGKISYIDLKYREYDLMIYISNILLQNHLSLINSSDLDTRYYSLNERGSYSYMWIQPRIYNSAKEVYYFRYYTYYISIFSIPKGRGLSLRYVAK